MNYAETIEYLYSQLPMFSVVGAGAYKPGLATAIGLSDAFGNPHLAYPTIHIAGTNGKGSTSSMLASILQEAGYNVGLYTSPHIFDFRERIKVNGEMIGHDSVVDFVERYIRQNLDCEPSFFELTTIMAFEYFKKKHVDVAVIETGLGGRLDTTNIITPMVSVITNVSLDHMAQLGDTEEAIAGEKAGIIKDGVPAVVGLAEGKVREAFASVANDRGSEIVFAMDTPISISQTGDDTLYGRHMGDKPQMLCALDGDFQYENVNTVMHAVDILNQGGALSISDDALARGFANVVKNTNLTGRWTRMTCDGIDVIIDTGHNIGAWRVLAQQLSRLSASHRLRVVLGFVSDKDIEAIFALLPKAAEYYFVTPGVKRGRKSSELMALAMLHGLNGNAYDTVMQGCNAAKKDSEGGDVIFIGGSNYVVAEITDFVNRC